MTTHPPRLFNVMAKPTGARCNLDCQYCFFLKKEKLYPASRFRMSDAVMEAYLSQSISACRGSSVTISWQGGEPTLMGLDFFRRTIEVEKKYLKPGMCVEHTLQTNGVLLDDAWCEFFRENGFLVGISLDGPREMTDAYRRNQAGKSVFDQVVRATRLMQDHHVQFNILCTVNAVNSKHPLDTYRFFRDELGAHYLQFIPIVEYDNESGKQGEGKVTDRSVAPDAYGQFLIQIFDEWVHRDVGTTFVVLFDSVLASWAGGLSNLCVFRPTCGDAAVLEHNGDLYSCDHFVEPEYLLGNIEKAVLTELMASEKQRRFGVLKSDSLPAYCRKCEFLFACYGECPKNRVLATPSGEPGLNWLCAGLKAFFKHVDGPMRTMAELLGQGRAVKDIMHILAQQQKTDPSSASAANKERVCPCGSGRKFVDCHGLI